MAADSRLATVVQPQQHHGSTYVRFRQEERGEELEPQEQGWGHSRFKHWSSRDLLTYLLNGTAPG